MVISKEYKEITRQIKKVGKSKDHIINTKYTIMFIKNMISHFEKQSLTIKNPMMKEYYQGHLEAYKSVLSLLES